MLAGCCHSVWLLTGHAQLPRPNHERDQSSRHRLDEAARRQEHEQRRQRDERGGGEGGAVPPPETVVFDIDEQVEHGVHRQPGQRGADTERVDAHLREHGWAHIVEVRRCGQLAFPVGGVGGLGPLGDGGGYGLLAGFRDGPEEGLRRDRALVAKEWRLSRFTLNSMLPTWSLPGRKSPLLT